jgi:hypothetical protein
MNKQKSVGISLGVLILIVTLFVNHKISAVNAMDLSIEHITDITQQEEYILRVKDEEGERLENAFATILIEDRSSDSLNAAPPRFKDYTDRGMGRYTFMENPEKMEDKRFTLVVHLEGYRQYTYSFNRYTDRDVTVVLMKL